MGARGAATVAAPDADGVHRSLWPDVEIPGTAVPQYVLERCPEFGDREALVDGISGRAITFDEIPRRVAFSAAQLVKEGLKAHDVVALYAPNLPEYPVAFQSVLAAGGTCTTVNALCTAEELAGQLSDSKTRFIFTVPPFLETAEKAAALSGVVEKIFVLGDEGCFVGLSTPASAPSSAADGLRAIDEILASQVPSFDPSTHLAALPYSSGTTGRPKGVMLTHRNLVANVAQTVDCPSFNLDLDEKDTMLGLLPMSHIYAMTVVSQDPMRRGAKVVTLPKFEPESFLKTLVAHKVSWAPLVPPLVLFLAKHPAAASADLSALRIIFSGAAPLDSTLQAAAQARVPKCSVRQGYGLSETSPVTHMAQGDNVRAGTVGYLAPNVEAKLVDVETGEVVKDTTGQKSGELWVRGPNIMAGYLGNPTATAETLVGDGWLRTGDVAAVDPDGQWRIVDRFKELIKVQGYQVAPAELEGVLLEHKSLADAAVVPVPHERKGEVPRAYVVRAATPEGEALTGASVAEWIAERLAHYKHLKGGVVFVDEIPKSPSGKILRRLLRDRAANDTPHP